MRVATSVEEGHNRPIDVVAMTYLMSMCVGNAMQVDAPRRGVELLSSPSAFLEYKQRAMRCLTAPYIARKLLIL